MKWDFDFLSFQNVLLCIFTLFWKQHWRYRTSMFQLRSFNWHCLFGWHFGRLIWEKNKSLYFLCSGNTFTNNNFLVSWCLSVFSFLFFETFFKIPFGNYTSQKNCILNKIHMLHYFQNLFFGAVIILNYNL